MARAHPRELGELPAAQRERLQTNTASRYDADVVHQGRALVAYFEDVPKKSGDAKAACNWATNQVLAQLPSPFMGEGPGVRVSRRFRISPA